jgi:hypothetical protein
VDGSGDGAALGQQEDLGSINVPGQEGLDLGDGAGRRQMGIDVDARRWNVELDIRNIKTTLGMEVLRCLSPQMVQKELWVSLLAYNLIRLLMAQAAHNAGVHPRELSFKHTVQMWTTWCTHTAHAPAQPVEFFRLIAQLAVGNRPGRIEPRARKRRPKSFPWLKVPRPVARRQIHRYGHLLCA